MLQLILLLSRTLIEEAHEHELSPCKEPNEIQTDSPEAKRKDPQNNTPQKIVRIIINTSPVTAGEHLHSRAFGKCS